MIFTWIIIESIVTSALAINELLQNAYEHAFSNKKISKIKKNQCIRLQMTKMMI